MAFVDRHYGSMTWEEYPSYDCFKSKRRNSRAPKIIPHQFVECDFSLWMDARVALKVPVGELITTWLDDCDLAVFAHKQRYCIYDEAAECARRNLDRAECIEAQISMYKRCGYGVNLGLADCSIILRRSTKPVETFNNYWWAEYCRHSVRDQISFMYAAWQSGLKIKMIPSPIRSNYFDILKREAKAEPIRHISRLQNGKRSSK